MANAVSDFAFREIQTKHPKRLASELPHLREIAVAADKRESPFAGSLFNSLGYHLRIRAAYTEAKMHYERALGIYKKVYGPDHPEVATVANNLGQILREQGDLEGALKYTQRALNIDERAYGADHHDVRGGRIGDEGCGPVDFIEARGGGFRQGDIDGLGHRIVDRDGR